MNLRKATAQRHHIFTVKCPYCECEIDLLHPHFEGDFSKMYRSESYEFEAMDKTLFCPNATCEREFEIDSIDNV